MEALGMKTLVVNGPVLTPSESSSNDFGEWLFSEADRRGWRIFVDTLAPPQWWTAPEAAPEIARARERIQTIERAYSGHASFQGWYIPYELYVFWGERADFAVDLLAGVSRACKESAPCREVMISPFFILDKQGYLGDFRYAEPAEYEAFWTRLLAASGVDIVALQDSGEHFACYTIEERRPFFEAMKRACDANGVKFWANVELAELNVASLGDYAARFGLKTHVNDPRTLPFWRGVPAAKLRAKLDFCAQYCSGTISWGYREYVRPRMGTMASEVYLDYFKLLGDAQAMK